MSFPNPYTSTLNDLLLAVLNHLGTKTEFEPRDIPNVYNDTTNDLLLSILAKITESSGKAWELGGNTIGTESNKLGTIDDVDLEIIRQNVRFILLEKGLAGNPDLISLWNKFAFSSNGNFTIYNPLTEVVFRILYDAIAETNSLEYGNDADDTFSVNASVYLPNLPNAASLATDGDGKVIAGSGGGGGGIDDVLAQNQILTDNRTIDIDDKDFNIEGSGQSVKLTSYSGGGTGLVEMKSIGGVEVTICANSDESRAYINANDVSNAEFSEINVQSNLISIQSGSDLLLIANNVHLQLQPNISTLATDSTGKIIDGSRPYRVYTALITQSGTNIPLARVFENTIGTVSISRNNPGEYYFTVSPFVDGTNYIAVLSTGIDSPTKIYTITTYQADAEIGLETFLNGVRSDNCLYDFFIEIRIYN